MFPVEQIRADFPILQRQVNGKSLVYFDNAATSQTPQTVIDAIVDYYSNYNANIHRGVHALSQEATDKYEQARITLQKHFNARHAYEMILERERVVEGKSVVGLVISGGGGGRGRKKKKLQSSM